MLQVIAIFNYHPIHIQMKMIIIYILGLLLLMASGQARATEPFEGAGGLSCTDFANKYQQSPQDMGPYFFYWAEGFMSGLNAMAPKVNQQMRDLSSLSFEEQERYLRHYCVLNPSSKYYLGVYSLYQTLKVINPTLEIR